MSGRGFYRLAPEEQRRQSFKRLRRYLLDYIEPYHPYLRRRYREAGIYLPGIRTYEDFCRLPVISKDDYRPDPRAFILQPKFPGREKEIPYDTAPIAGRLLLKYVWQALINRPRDLSGYFRKNDFKTEKVGRKAAWEWLPIHFHGSAGTTGDPTPAAYTARDIWVPLQEMAHFAFIRPDVLDGKTRYVHFADRAMNLFPGMPHLAFFQTVISKFLLSQSILDTGGGRVMPTERQIEVFAKQGFHAMTAIPSYFTHWLREAAAAREQGKIDNLANFFIVLLGGEGASDSLKKYFREMAKRAGAHEDFHIIETYGMTEMKWAFLECFDDRGMHLNPKFFYWEVLDPETLQPVADGQPGVIVFSHIDWRGTVFIRYNTGDLAAGGIRWERCAYCGRTFPILHGPLYRAVKDFTKIKGTRVSLPELIRIVRDEPGVRDFQVILDKEISGDEFSRDWMRLRVLPEPNADRDDLQRRLREKIRVDLEISPNEIVFEENEQQFTDELFAKTGIKAEYIVDRRPRSPHSAAH